MQRAARAQQELSHCRDVLLRFLGKVSDDELRWQLFPTSKSMAEILLHVAGFEFIVVQALPAMRDRPVDFGLWQRIKGGFAREAGFASPKVQSATDCTAAMHAVRQRTEQVLLGGQNRLISTERYDVRGAIDTLAGLDEETANDVYDTLFAATQTSFNDDISADGEGRIDWANLIIVHETYHRGQLTLLRYVTAQSRGAA